MSNPIPATVTVWIDAKRELPKYQELYNHVVALAGEGDLVTPEQLGLPRRSFAYDELRLLQIPGGYAVYSIDRPTGEMDVELISNYIKEVR
jgi:hypothetical protein